MLSDFLKPPPLHNDPVNQAMHQVENVQQWCKRVYIHIHILLMCVCVRVCVCDNYQIRWACSGNIHRAIASSYNHVPAGIEVPLYPHEHRCEDRGRNEVKRIVGHDLVGYRDDIKSATTSFQDLQLHGSFSHAKWFLTKLPVMLASSPRRSCYEYGSTQHSPGMRGSDAHEMRNDLLATLG